MWRWIFFIFRITWKKPCPLGPTSLHFMAGPLSPDLIAGTRNVSYIVVAFWGTLRGVPCSAGRSRAPDAFLWYPTFTLRAHVSPQAFQARGCAAFSDDCHLQSQLLVLGCRGLEAFHYRHHCLMVLETRRPRPRFSLIQFLVRDLFWAFRWMAPGYVFAWPFLGVGSRRWVGRTVMSLLVRTLILLH